MKIVPRKHLTAVLDDLNDVLKARDIQEAYSAGYAMIATYETKLPKLAKYLEDNLGDVMTFLAFPKHQHRKIHSTNVLERFNKEVKRRTKVVGAFPSEGSVLRLLVPLAVDTNAKWLDRKYISWVDLEHDCKFLIVMFLDYSVRSEKKLRSGNMITIMIVHMKHWII